MSTAVDPRLPPLVEPGEGLTVEELTRYSRHVILPDVGTLGQRRLKNARVLVIGAGGLGSPALLYLAAAGVGTIGIVDDDVVDSSNLQRQVVHGHSDVGRLKVDSARDRIAEVNPGVAVRRHGVRLDRSNVLEVLRGYHLVLDGTDNFPTRYLVSDACSILGLPEVWGSIYRFDGQVSVFWAGHGPTYRDVFAAPPPPGSVPSCAEGGVLGVLCAMIGSVMATEAVKLICGIGEPLLGRLMVLDALDMSWRTVRIRRNPESPVITELPAEESVESTEAQSCTVGAESAAIGVRELEAMLAARSRGDLEFELVDVREPHEREIVTIAGSVGIPRGELLAAGGLARLPTDRRIVLHCKTGARSASTLAALKAAGRSDVVHVSGGVLAWVREIDPSLPSY